MSNEQEKHAFFKENTPYAEISSVASARLAAEGQKKNLDVVLYTGDFLLGLYG